MDIAALVDRGVVAVARSTAQRTRSPLLRAGAAGQEAAAAALARIEQLAERCPDLFTALAQHLDMPATVPEVLADVDRTALRLLAAFQAPDHHQSFSCSP